MTSPCARDPRPQMVGKLTLSLRNRTEPSPIMMLARPGWKLLNVNMPPLLYELRKPQLGYLGLGPRMTLPRVSTGSPIAQYWPRVGVRGNRALLMLVEQSPSHCMSVGWLARDIT